MDELGLAADVGVEIVLDSAQYGINALPPGRPVLGPGGAPGAERKAG